MSTEWDTSVDKKARENARVILVILAFPGLEAAYVCPMSWPGPTTPERTLLLPGMKLISPNRTRRLRDGHVFVYGGYGEGKTVTSFRVWRRRILRIIVTLHETSTWYR